MVARYHGQALRRLLRGDAAFALPDVYEYLEAEGFQYAIRLPANQVLQAQLAPLLTRPVGRPPHYVRRFYASFRYQAQSWSRSRRVVAKVEWHPGELYPRAGFIVTNLRRSTRKVVAFYNGRGTAEQWIKEGKHAIKWTRLSCTTFARTPSDSNSTRWPTTSPTSSAPWRSREGRAMVADQPAGEGGEDRREGDRPRSLRDLPNGGSRRAVPAVRPHPGADRKATSARPRPMLTLEGGNARQPEVEPRPECVLRLPQSGPDGARRRPGAPWRASRSCSRPPRRRKNSCLRGHEGVSRHEDEGGPRPIGKCRLMME